MAGIWIPPKIREYNEKLNSIPNVPASLKQMRKLVGEHIPLLVRRGMRPIQKIYG